MSNSILLRRMSRIRASFAALALSWTCLLGAAANAGPLGDLDADDLAVVESLALYDESLRRDALEAAGEADVLGALVAQQDRSSATFRQLLDPYDRQVQEDLFELARYPELVSEIVTGGPKSQSQLETIAARYPAEVSTAAARSGHEYWKVVARTDALLRDETESFEASIAHLPENKRRAFRSLVAAPDLLALLADNTGVAVLLGDAYDREPEAMLAWLTEVERDVSERGRDETRELAAALEDDEELADQIGASTAAYESEIGVSAYAQPVSSRSSVIVNISPFPFWIGHPWWYASTYSYYDPWYFWYPRFAWSFGGSYFGPHYYASFGFGWPHSAFWGWYFHSPRHHAYYPRLTHHVVNHYDRRWRHHSRYRRQRDWGYRGERHSRPGRHAVHRFVRDAERSMPRGFMRNDGRREERLREFGRLHEGRRGSSREPGARRADGRGDRRDSLVRRARADRSRYPRLAELSRDPERRPGADRRERARRSDRRNASRAANVPDVRSERRGDRDRANRAERNSQRKGRETRTSTGTRERRGGSEARDRDAAASRGAERRAERGKQGARRDRPRAEAKRADAPRVERRRETRSVEAPRAERRREAKRVESPRAERRRDTKRAERRRTPPPVVAPTRDRRAAPPPVERQRSASPRESRPAPAPQAEKRSAPRAEKRSSRRAEKRSSRRAEKRSAESVPQARGGSRKQGHGGGGDRGGHRGGGGGKGGRGRGGR